MRTLIAIPCMDLVHVQFMRSLLLLNTNGTEIYYEIASGSLIYDARNRLLQTAKAIGADRIFWLDSDMQIPTDALQMLSKDIDEGCEIVSGLYHGRRPPYAPIIFKECCVKKLETGELLPTADKYLDYPKDDLFKVAAFGFGCVLMTMNAAEKVMSELGKMPFMPTAGFGEDLSFCMRANHVGIELWCDSRVKCGHIGYRTYTDQDYRGEDDGNA